MKLQSTLGIRLRLLVIISILPGLGIALYNSLDQQKELTTNAKDQAETTVALLVRDQLKLIDQTHNFLINLAELPSAQRPDDPDCTQLLKKLLAMSPDYVNLGIPGPDGALRCNALPLQKKINVADRDYIKRAQTVRGLAIGDFQHDRAADQTTVNFAYPVIDQKSDTVLGVAVAVISTQWWHKRLQELQLPIDAISYIVDSQGAIIASYPDQPALLGRDMVHQFLPDINFHALQAKQFSAIFQNKRYQFSQDQIQHPLQLNTFSVYVGIPTDISSTQVYLAFIKQLGALLLVGIIILTFASYRLQRTVLKPLSNLLSAAKHIEQGIMPESPLPPSGSIELDELARHFTRMASSIKNKEQQLRTSEGKYRSLLDNIPATIYTIDLTATSQRLYVSPYVEKLLGFEQQLFIASPEYYEASLHPDDRQMVVEAIQHARQNNTPFSLEYRMISRHGKVIWVRDDAHFVTDESIINRTYYKV